MGCRAPNWLLKAGIMNVGSDEHEVPVSFPVCSSWAIKTCNAKGFPPAFQTAELWFTLSGWGASRYYFSSWLLKVAAVQLRAGGHGIQVGKGTPVLKSPVHFILYGQLITTIATASEQGVKPPAVLLPTKTCSGALVLSSGGVNLEFLTAEWPSVKVVVTQRAANRSLLEV